MALGFCQAVLGNIVLEMHADEAQRLAVQSAKGERNRPTRIPDALEHKIGLRGGQNTIQLLGEVRTWKSAPGVSFVA